MNKQDVINEAKQQMEIRFATMTHNEFEQLQAGDGTLSVLDDVLDMLPIVFRIINPEVKQIVEEFNETDIDELVQYCITLSDERYNYFAAMNSDDAYEYLEKCGIDFDVILDCKDTKSIHEWIEYAMTLLIEVTKDLQKMNDCDDIIKHNKDLMIRLYNIQ